MSLTLSDLKDKLLREDEVSLLEILNISTEDILDRFEDRIEERYDQIVGEYEPEEDSEDEEYPV